MVKTSKRDHIQWYNTRGKSGINHPETNGSVICTLSHLNHDRLNIAKYKKGHNRLSIITGLDYWNGLLDGPFLH